MQVCGATFLLVLCLLSRELKVWVPEHHLKRHFDPVPIAKEKVDYA